MSEHEAALWAVEMAAEYSVAVDVRPTLRAAIAARYGTTEGAYTALARDLAPRWMCTVASAKQRLSRFFSEDERQFRDMTSRPLAVLLDVLGVDLVMRGGM